MSVTREEVLRIAQLAELDVDDESVPALTREMSGILDYVAQLGQQAGGEPVRPFLAGPDAVRARPDEVRPWPLAFPPQEMAPVFRDGFFVVPRLGAFDDAGEGGK